MTRPHPALIEVAAGRSLPVVGDAAGLIRSAFEHKMGGLLWSRALTGELVLDDQWKQVLSTYDIRNWARHTQLQDGLLRACARLDSIGVTAATAKGITAEARWYARTGERPCFDIDLLIGPADFGRIDDILAELAPDHSLRHAARELIDRGRLLSINLDVGGLPVDLHFDMLKLDILPSRQRGLLWQRRVPFRFADGRVVDVLDAETSLIQLILQLNKDSFSYLLGFADVARICGDASLDWRFIDDFLRGEGLADQLYAALEVVFRTLQLRAPVVPGTKGWRGRVWRIVWRPSNRLQGDAGIIRSQRRNWWLPLTARGRTLEAIRAILARLFPPRPLLGYYYPAAHGPYLWRLASGRLGGAVQRRRVARNIGRLAPARVAHLAHGPRADGRS